MPKPQYPTKEGIWSKGMRQEESYKRVRLELPFPEAVENFRQATKDREDFDPAVVFVWGTIQATAVLNILKAAEETFGQAGQEIVRKALNQAGYEAMAALIERSEFPDDLDRIELMSYLATAVNTVLYASLEKPWSVSKESYEFDILWCPHQDRYTAFDCRVQRYIVEGMIQAMEDQGKGGMTPVCEKLIPHGADCCHFSVRPYEEGDNNPWHIYSEELARRALEKLGKKK